MNRVRDLRAAALVAAPTLACGAALVAGGLLLLSGATPTEPERLERLSGFAPLALVDLSHFVSSLIGLALVLLAFGLRRRLDAAWTTTMVLLAAAAALAVLKGINVEETAVLVGLLVLLAPLRDAFDRRASLNRMELSPGWLMSALAVLVGAWLLGRWVFQNADYTGEAFWRVLADRDAERAVRATAGAAILLLTAGLWRLLASPARPKVVGETDPDFARVKAILASAEAAPPEAGLALLGDKRFLFSESGRSFLMFGVRGRSWIAVGPPVGLRSERMELLWRFRELADARAVRPGLYNIGPEDLPDVVDLGFAIQKIGEAAAVPLADFSLSGRRREVLRRNWRKAGEAGASFEVVPPEGVAALLPELRRVSDAWLAGQAGGEKAFSLGGFVDSYVVQFPCAVVRFGGRVIAFATLWESSDKSAFSMDLMRYEEGGPKNIMDFLFVELLTWGKAQGYAVFEFGVAPLAGAGEPAAVAAVQPAGAGRASSGARRSTTSGRAAVQGQVRPGVGARAMWPRRGSGRSRWPWPDVGLMSSGGWRG
jgi:phosphatidylglycerol lysyltransferase